MLEFPEFELIRIVIGFILYSALGFVTYSQNTPTGKFWLKEMEMNVEDMQPNPKSFGLYFLFNFLTTWGIYVVISWAQVENIGEGIVVALFIWMTFTISSTFASVAFESRKVTIWGVYTLYQLISFILLGIVFSI